MPVLRVFRYDRWIKKEITTIEEGEMFINDGKQYIATGEPRQTDGVWHIPAKRPEEKPIKLLLDSSGALNDYVAMAMDYCVSGVCDFDDGTYMIGELAAGPGFIYSPRLTAEKLNDFCEVNFPHYEEFLSKNEAAIEQGKLVPMKPFW